MLQVPHSVIDALKNVAWAAINVRDADARATQSWDLLNFPRLAHWR